MQCREIRNLAWKHGKTLHFLPTLLTALWTENLLDYHTFSGAEISPCVHCHSPEGATAAHFLSGGDNEDLRKAQLFPALIKAVRDRCSRDDISDQEILTQLTFVPEAPPLPATMLDTDPDAIVGFTPGGKPVVNCPKCGKQYSFSDRLGRIVRHTCTPPDEKGEEDTRPQPLTAQTPVARAAASTTSTEPIQTCPLCRRKVRYSARLGRLYKHKPCIAPDADEMDTEENPVPAAEEGKSKPPRKRRPQQSRPRDRVRKACPKCEGSFTVNKDGSLRRHDCIGQPKQNQKLSGRRPKKKSRPNHPATPPPSPSPAPPQPPEPRQGPRPVPAFRMWKHRRTQNAFTIATFTGILTTAAIAFLQFCIPNPLARASAIKNIRIAWLEYAYTAWRRHRNLMRSKDAARKYIRKRKGRSRPIGKDPPRPRNSKAQRADDPIPSMHHQSGEDQPVDDLNAHDPDWFGLVCIRRSLESDA
jgi:hypothetical protein